MISSTLSLLPSHPSSDSKSNTSCCTPYVDSVCCTPVRQSTTILRKILMAHSSCRSYARLSFPASTLMFSTERMSASITTIMGSKRSLKSW